MRGTSCRPAGCLSAPECAFCCLCLEGGVRALGAGLIDERGLVTRRIKRAGARAGGHDGGRGRASAHLAAAVEDCRAQRRC